MTLRIPARLGACGVALALVAAATAPGARASDRLIHDASPAVSPNGRWIAFTSNRDSLEAVYIVGADGKGERRISPAGFAAEAPRWSRDGRAVLCSGVGADSGGVFALAAFDTTPPRRLARVPGRSPRLSPDGKRVLYLTGPWTATRMWAANPDGRNPTALTAGATIAWNGAWSPDGKLVAYTYGDSTRLLQVHIVRKDGQADRALTQVAPSDGSAQIPAWSPDGKRIAFQVTNRRARTAHVWVIDVSKGDPVKLAAHDAPYLDEAPAWFPDGKRIAFQSDRTGAMEIWTMNADGTEARQITGTSP